VVNETFVFNLVAVEEAPFFTLDTLNDLVSQLDNHLAQNWIMKDHQNEHPLKVAVYFVELALKRYRRSHIQLLTQSLNISLNLCDNLVQVFVLSLRNALCFDHDSKKMHIEMSIRSEGLQTDAGFCCSL